MYLLMPFSIGKFLLQIFQNPSIPLEDFFNGPIELTDFCQFVDWKRLLTSANLLIENGISIYVEKTGIQPYIIC